MMRVALSTVSFLVSLLAVSVPAWANNNQADGVGTIFDSLADNMDPLRILVAVGTFVLGLYLGLVGIKAFRNHADNPNATPLTHPLWKITAAVLLIALPNVMGVGIASFFGADAQSVQAVNTGGGGNGGDTDYDPYDPGGEASCTPCSAGDGSMWSVFDPYGNGINDVSMTWLSSAFGNPLEDDGVTTMMGHMVVVVNLAILAIAALALTYKIIVGVIQTAHEGVALGRRWSTLWGPLRTVLGIAAIVPLPSGFCLAQVVVLLVAKAGIGLANHVWCNSVEGMTRFGTPLAPVANADFEPMARQAFDIALCLAIANSYYYYVAGPDSQVNRDTWPDASADGWQVVGLLNTPVIGNSTVNTSNNQLAVTMATHTYRFGGVDTKYNFRDDVCGTITTVGPKDGQPTGIFGDVTDDDMDFYSASEYYSMFGGNNFDNIRMRMVQNISGTTHGPAFEQLLNSYQDIAREIVRDHLAFSDAGGNHNPLRVSQAISAYSQTVTQRVGQVISDASSGSNGGQSISDAFCQATTSGGWVFAGTWWMQMANLNGTVSRVAQTMPTLGGPNWGSLKQTIGDPDLVDNVLAFSNTYWEEAVYQGDWDGRNGIAARAMSYGAQADSASLRGDSLLDQVMQKAWEMVSSGLGAIGDSMDIEIGVASADGFGDAFQGVVGIGNSAEERANPMAALTGMGQFITNVSLGFMGGGYFAFHAADTLENLPGSNLPIIGGFIKTAGAAAGAVARASSGILMVVGKMLLIPGIVLGYILPMLPYVLWIGVVVGWFVLVCEAMIAAPIWAMAHMRMDGEGFAGPAAEKGYYLLFSMMLRPALAVIAFVLGQIVFIVMTPFLWQSFSLAFRVAGVDNIVGNIVSAFIFAGVTVWMAYKIFGFASDIPDRVLRWMNMSGEGLDEMGALRDTRMVAMAAIGQMAGNIGGPTERPKVGNEKSSGLLEKGDGDGKGGGNASGRRTNEAATRLAGRGGPGGGAMGAIGNAMNKGMSGGTGGGGPGGGGNRRKK